MENNRFGHPLKRTWLSAAMRLVLVLAIAGGCSQRNFYRPKNLPPELAAIPVPNVKRLDLSGLAGPSAGTALIQPGDVLELSIAGGLSNDAVVDLIIRVGDDGNAHLPDLGPVRLAGFELADAEQAIAMACIERGLYLQPHVAATLKHQRKNRITVVGAVEKPGIVELPRGQSYLLDAVVAAGGLSDEAGPNVDIRVPNSFTGLASEIDPDTARGGVMPVSASGAPAAVSQSHRVNIVDAVMSGSGGQYLADNAVVVVERQELAPVQVIGLVKEPGEYPYPVERPLDVLGALALAKGLSNPFADKIFVIRHRAGMPDPAVIEVSLRNAKRIGRDNVRLEPGDVVSIERSAGTAVWDAINIVRFSLGSSVPLF